MNHYFPDWNLDPEHPEANHGKALGSSQELVELLWENGQVVLNNQTHRKPVIDPIESRQGGKFNQSSNHVEGFSLINPPILAQGEDHPVSWNHCQIDDPFEKELSSFLLAELPPISNLDLAHEKRPIHQHLDSFKFCNNDGSQISHVLPYNGHSETLCGNSSHPTKFQKLNSVIPHANIAEVVSTRKHAPNNPSHYGGGSSHCGSNQVIHDADTSLASCSEVGRRMPKIAAEVEDSYGKVASESERSNDRETAVSLSGGGSGFTSIGGRWNQSNGNNSSKRKIRDEENSEPQSEAAFLEADTRKKASQKTGITRKSRAAEVHNLSERRRRDRVNEKMRALQELLPRSNQTDKASMLDDAIKYMRSLQLQLQMMWMGSQMAMFPGCQVPPYMSRSELGISPQMLPFIQSGMNLSRLPLMDQAMAVASTPNQAAICQATFLNSMSYQNQFQNSNFSDQYGNCMGFYPIQNANQQPMNMYSYGSNIPLQNQAPPSAANGPPS